MIAYIHAWDFIVPPSNLEAGRERDSPVNIRMRQAPTGMVGPIEPELRMRHPSGRAFVRHRVSPLLYQHFQVAYRRERGTLRKEKGLIASRHIGRRWRFCDR